MNDRLDATAGNHIIDEGAVGNCANFLRVLTRRDVEARDCMSRS
nr:hypothetical protein [Henriciella sp.]